MLFSLSVIVEVDVFRCGFAAFLYGTKFTVAVKSSK
jgi:hypothetical protein